MMIKPLESDQLGRLLDAYPRGWFIHYWEEVCLVLSDRSYPDKVEAFFYLVERLLKEGKVKFDLPLDDQRQDEFWEDLPEVIVAHLRGHWPAEVTYEGDPAIVDFFYDTQRCPPVSWLGEDGQWHGS